MHHTEHVDSHICVWMPPKWNQHKLKAEHDPEQVVASLQNQKFHQNQSGYLGEKGRSLTWWNNNHM